MTPDDVARLSAPRMPRAAWEGWFWIAIPAAPSPVRWAKVHVFRSDPQRGVPIAAVEALTAERELRSWVAAAAHVDERRSTPAAGAIVAVNAGVHVHGDDALSARRDHDRWRLDHGKVAIELAPRDRIVWARVPRVLTYVGVHCDLDGEIAGEPVRGLGVLEHAWGASLPVHPSRLVRGPWHWDVLSVASSDSEPVDFAALAVSLPALGARGARARGRAPGSGEASSFSSFAVRVLERATPEPGDPAPRRWTAELRGRAGALHYEAVASTPVARPAPDVAFLGFDFEGTWRPRAGAALRVRGRGFSEHGGTPLS